MRTIIVTGTPGTGKTTLSKKLSLLLDYTYFDVGLFVKKAHLYTSYDRKRQSYVVDASKLSRALIKVRGKASKEAQKGTIRRKPNGPTRGSEVGIIFDSHLSHCLPARYADLCIVARCELKTLKKRLVGKGYSPAKVRENLDAEIFDTCHIEALENGHRVAVFDTTAAKNSDVKALAARIRKLVRTKSGLGSD